MIFKLLLFITFLWNDNLSAYNKELMKLLEAGDFEKYNEMLSARAFCEEEYRRNVAWSFLYRGDYSRGFATLSVPSDDFLYRYLEFMSAVEKNFLTKESEHFKIRYFAQDEIMIDFALLQLERIYQKNGQLLNYFPADKVLVEIYPDKETFAVASTLGKEILEKSGTVGICKFNRLMILSPRNLPLGYRWLDTLSHEYSHFLINRITRFNCPLWLHEGISRYIDTLWRLESPNYLSDYSVVRLKDAVEKNKLIPFEKMSPSLVYLPTQDDISLAFAQVGSFVDFFVSRYGLPELRKWLEHMKDTNEKVALKKVTKISFSSMVKSWRQDLKSKKLQNNFEGIPDVPMYKIKSEEDLLSIDAYQHIRLGDMLRKQGVYDGALLQYKKAYSKEKSAITAVKIAKVQNILGQKDEAKTLLTDVIKGNQNYITPYLLLYEISLSEADKEKAKFYCEEAFSINPFYPGLYDTLTYINRK